MKRKFIPFMAMSLFSVSLFGQTWNTSGNSLTTPNTEFLGTTNAQPLTIKTNNLDRIIVKENGNQNFSGKFIFSGINHDTSLFTITNYHSLHRAIALGSSEQPIKDYDLFNVQTIDSRRISWPSQQPAISTHFKISGNGNVGININDPQALLHVHNGFIRVTGNNTAGGPMIIFGGNPQTNSGDWGIEYAKSTTKPTLKGLNFWKPAGSGNFGNYFLFLADNGNVGIGTDNPGSFKLAVEGKIGAREIKVTMNNPWPDYVFDSTYKLLSLGEVSNFIKKNKHLRGIKSSKELHADNGINLGEMQAAQMKKIEEIYLYLIDMQKQITELKLENEKLKIQLDQNNIDKNNNN